MTHRTLFPPPDENRALEQLERLHREILRARRDRERAGADFEGFVEEFRSRPQDGGAVPSERAGRRAPRPILPTTERGGGAEESAKPSVVTTPRSTLHLTPDSPPASSSIAEGPDKTGPFSAMVAPERGTRKGLLLATAIVLLVGAASALYFWQRTQQPAADQQQAAPVPAQTAPPATATPSVTTPPSASIPRSAEPPPPQGAPEPTVSPSTVRLTTDRAVWMRVTVDGRKVLEREVPAGQRLTYTPAQSIVVRAGDAGGVRVKLGNGPEEVLGRDAFPLTRRFEVPKQ